VVAVPLAIDIAIAKTNKYASRESGDTVEIVERPGGGMSVIMADGQGSGRAAKVLSMLVTAKVSALLKEGVRDGASARAANDFLFAMRHGQVSATLDILSVDLKTQSVVITRNGDTGCLISMGMDAVQLLATERPIGIYARTRPLTAELPLSSNLRVVVVSDGVLRAGAVAGGQLPGFDSLVPALAQDVRASELADAILTAAIARDGGRPRDDMSVIVLALIEHQNGTLVRRMTAEVPLP
jgi:serine phosphatase RsbU (regulator of sigma subunit)